MQPTAGLILSESDRIKWDQRYRAGNGPGSDAPSWLNEIEKELPTQGRALDIAAGAGRIAVFLARRGLDVVAVDISRVGLELATRSAEKEGVQIDTLVVDLESESLPTGPFDVITCFHYRQRDLFPQVRSILSPGGVFVAEIATLPNLERHAHPSIEYLAEPDELRQDCAPLEIVYYEEGWFEEHALARVVARKQFVGNEVP